VDATAKDSEVVLVDIELVSDPPMAQKHPNADENSPPQDAIVSLNFLIGSEIVLTCDFQEGQENAPPLVRPAKSNPILAQSSVSSKIIGPSPTSCFSQLNDGHALARGEKHTSMAEIIMRGNSAADTPPIKYYSSFTKASRSVLKKIAPFYARRKTPPPLPPKPPPSKRTKKQLELVQLDYISEPL
jgi:hypothetical protein